MKVLYDHQTFLTQIYGGISRYFFEIMNCFFKNGDDFELSLKCSSNIYIKKSSFIKIKPFFESFNFKGRHRLLSFINKASSRKKIKKGGFDVFHPTYFDPYFLDYIGDKPFVLTVHDMIHELFPAMFSSRDRTSEWKKMLVNRAAKIIAISESTKRDIIKLYGIDEQKISVIYHGNSLSIGNYFNGMDIKLPNKYLLFVGDRHLYKNFNNFIKSVSLELKSNKDLNIVCGGGKTFTYEEINLFRELDIKNRVYHFPITNDEILAYLYKNAIAFVFPSLYEGFGIPVLEAFSCGCPVIASNTSSLPEVAGDAAEYFDPSDINSMRQTIRKIIYDENLRKRLKEKGFERIKIFSWEKTAKQTKEVYQSII